ncbi:MAG TPA: hypothetical protein VFL59_02585 [Candidatus Nanopelagicales bacterium]|nr:hypothetical protein [Candidatus Nanopelagicales bacterium]
MRRLDGIWTRPTWISLLVALVYCLIVLVAAATLPVYGWSSQSSSAADGAAVESTSGTATLLEVNGPWALVVVSVPLLVTLVVGALLTRRTGWVGVAVACILTVLYVGLCILALLSIGIFLAPIALVLVVACASARIPTVPSVLPDPA